MKGFFDYEELKKFIHLVRQQPALYDPSAKNNSAQSTADVWAKITAEMKVPSMQVSDWKTKWKCLRDTFVKKKKDIRLAETQIAVDKATHWRFYDHMSFLDRFVDRTGNKTVPRSNGSDYQHYTIIKGEEFAEGDSIEEGAEEANSSSGKHSANESLLSGPGSPKRRRFINHNAEVDSGDDMQDDEDEEDEDGDDSQQPWNVDSSNSQSFFMSCAYRMDRLPDRVQSYLQLQISQLFFNAENPDVPPVPIMPLPPRSSSTTATTTKTS